MGPWLVEVITDYYYYYTEEKNILFDAEEEYLHHQFKQISNKTIAALASSVLFHFLTYYYFTHTTVQMTLITFIKYNLKKKSVLCGARELLCKNKKKDYKS